MNEKYKALAELLKDEENAKEVLSESVEETQANLKAKGLDFTVKELIDMADKILGKGELNEEQLDDVNGGILMPTLLGSQLAKKAFAIWVRSQIRIV